MLNFLACINGPDRTRSTVTEITARNFLKSVSIASEHLFNLVTFVRKR